MWIWLKDLVHLDDNQFLVKLYWDLNVTCKIVELIFLRFSVSVTIQFNFQMFLQPWQMLCFEVTLRAFVSSFRDMNFFMFLKLFVAGELWSATKDFASINEVFCWMKRFFVSFHRTSSKKFMTNGAGNFNVNLQVTPQSNFVPENLVAIITLKFIDFMHQTHVESQRFWI